MAFARTRRLDATIGDLNTTPLIDVMLVLLMMFIITIPIATHSVETDLGNGEQHLNFNPVKNSLVVSRDGAILWNSTPTDKPQLLATLKATRDLPVEPELHYQPDADAPYAVAAEVIAIVKRSGVTHFGFVGNEQYVNFGKD